MLQIAPNHTGSRCHCEINTVPFKKYLVLYQYHMKLQRSRVQSYLHRPMVQDLAVQGMQQCIMIHCVSSRVMMAI